MSYVINSYAFGGVNLAQNGAFQLNASRFTAYPGYFNFNGNPTIEEIGWQSVSMFGRSFLGGVATAANPTASPWRPSFVDAVATPSWLAIEGFGLVKQDIVLDAETRYNLTFDLAGIDFGSNTGQVVVQIADGISEVLVGSGYTLNSASRDRFTGFSLGFIARNPQAGRSWRIEIVGVDSTFHLPNPTEPIQSSGTPILLITNIRIVAQ